jgi:LacI family transcriptional regulator
MTSDEPGKRAGIHEIARRAKVSIGTVDRALHHRPGVSEATRQKILAIARKLNYTPHPAARALSLGHAVRIGVCIPEEIHFFYDQMRAGIFDEARRFEGAGVEIVYRPVPKLGEGEAEQMQALIKSEVKGIIVVPGGPQQVTPLIDEAEAEGIHVVCVSTDAPKSRRSCVVCVDPLLNGTLAAEIMGKSLPAGSQVAIVTGMLSTEDHRLKSKGFADGFSKHCPGGAVAAVIEAHESEWESYEKTKQLFAEHPNIAGIYVNTVNCLPVCQVVEERRAGEVRLVTTDLFRQMAVHFLYKTIYASIYQDPYLQGQTAVRLLADRLISRMALPPSRYLNPRIVLETNLPLFRETW